MLFVERPLAHATARIAAAPSQPSPQSSITDVMSVLGITRIFKHERMSPFIAPALFREAGPFVRTLSEPGREREGPAVT